MHMADGAKIVALGPKEEIAGLASLGVEVAPVESPAELEAALPERARDPAPALILVSETVAGEARDLIAGLRRPGGAVILLVPSHRGSAGMALEWMKHGMEQSIGVDLITKK